MTRITSIAIAFGFLAISVVPQSASAVSPWGTRAANIYAAQYAQQQSWHGGYRYMDSGYPQALVVPPTANMQTNYSWGVGSSRMTPIHHQWGRPDPGATSSAAHLGTTPYWPTSTTQFGVYYVRGPWNYHAAQPNYGHHGRNGLCNGCGRQGCNGRCGHGHHGSRSACGCNSCQSGKGSCTGCATSAPATTAPAEAAPAEAPANAPPAAPIKGEV
jgi:hypothetical protein